MDRYGFTLQCAISKLIYNLATMVYISCASGFPFHRANCATYTVCMTCNITSFVNISTCHGIVSMPSSYVTLHKIG